MHKSVHRRIRYFLGNIYRQITWPLYGFSIETSCATSVFGCGFARDGWHHLVQTMKEYENDSHFDVARSSLWVYLTEFRPKSISFLAGVVEEEPLPLFVLPWGRISSRPDHKFDNLTESRFCGPSKADFIHEEFRKTISLLGALRAGGYSPTKYPNSYIQGMMLENNEGERRFIPLQGNHRLAALSHLGVDRIEVRLSPRFSRIVKESSSRNWPMVKNKLCSEEHALRVFNFYFRNNGSHVKSALFDE